MVHARIGLAAAAVLVVAASLPQQGRARPFGFTPESARRQATLERQFLSQPDASRIRDTHRLITSRPHPAGSPRDRELADWTAQQFRDAGMEDVRITTHEVWLPKPLEVSVEMTHPKPWRASMREDPVGGDPDTAIDAAAVGPPYHAYSASGEVAAPVVYAGDGTPSDYDWLAARGVDVRGSIVLVRYSKPYSYRGFKALTAQQRGAAGILMFSDPAADGSAKGKPYPDGPWGPDSRIERGGIVYDFLTPGDPLTPGWPSVPGARRIGRADALSLPKIVSAPLSASDARPILEALDGPVPPPGWRAALPGNFHVGPGPARVRMKVRSDDAVRPVWTVTGLFRGSESPDDVVIVGNHRDAWLYGGVDPSSGSAALVELARSIGVIAHDGWKPRRSILFASWDAEEFALTSSTEWGEQHEGWLRDHAVAYLNVDSAAAGSRFVAAAVPSLARLVAEVAQAVRDPITRVPVAALARERRSTERGARGGETDEGFVDDRPGGGSDYTVFLNHLGIPIADLAFDGAYGVYHSAYDTHEWVARFGDPGFRYHVLPLDPAASAARITGFLREIEQRSQSLGNLDGDRQFAALNDLRAAAEELAKAALLFNVSRTVALERGDRATLEALNQKLLRYERAFLDPEGLPGRPWYRHLIHAPKFTYEPEILPGVAEAIEIGDKRRVIAQAARLAAALHRAAAQLSGLDPTHGREVTRGTR
jgi:N-acetylated-alpha-linked acidic dipeptidase